MLASKSAEWLRFADSDCFSDFSLLDGFDGFTDIIVLVGYNYFR